MKKRKSSPLQSEGPDLEKILAEKETQIRARIEQMILKSMDKHTRAFKGSDTDCIEIGQAVDLRKQ
jgi:hypothetical protein